MRASGSGPKVYRSFEEFEREELRRLSSLHYSVDEMFDESFVEELDFDPDRGSGGRSVFDDE